MAEPSDSDILTMAKLMRPDVNGDITAIGTITLKYARNALRAGVILPEHERRGFYAQCMECGGPVEIKVRGRLMGAVGDVEEIIEIPIPVRQPQEAPLPEPSPSVEPVPEKVPEKVS